MSEQTPEAAPHTPHSRHSAELRERAFELHCQFQSNHAIAAALDVPERTVRSWIREILDETTKNLRERRVEFLQEAVVSQRAIAAAAWNAFTLTLDHERARLASDAPSPAPPSRVGKGVGGVGSDTTAIYRSARLLHVAFAAQREIAHLLRLYDNDVVPKQTVEILITRNPPWPEPDPSDYIPGSPDDPNYRPDDHPSGGGGGRTDDHDDHDDHDDTDTDHDHDHDPPADLYAGIDFPDDFKPNGMDYWRELHGYPPRPMPGGPLDPNPTPAPRSPRSPEGQQLDSPSPRGRGGWGVRSNSQPPTPDGQRVHSPFPPQGEGGRGDEDYQEGRGERSDSENPATPATAPTSADAASADDAIPPTPTPTSAPPSGGPGDRQPERPDYPIAWLFPPGAPIPRPYRNAPPRPDRAFFNNPLHW